jgi:hypothetical protein
MLTTFTNARNFTEAGDTQPVAANKPREAALTALGVLIPGEVVAAATAVSGFLAKKSDSGDGTAIWEQLYAARALMLVLGVVAIPLLFRVGSGSWFKNGWRGLVLVVMTIVSFAGWLALQPLSIYQGWFQIDEGLAAAIGVVGGLVIASAAASLGWSQAKKEPEPE